ncbi:unnamed protein product [Amoebophrya sp. A25]|nr:unnamed protein product [Amoebophrya sp. A25]|eukprot:GSA25T00009255001.1
MASSSPSTSSSSRDHPNASSTLESAFAGVLGSQMALVILYPVDQLRLFAQLGHGRQTWTWRDLYGGLIPMMQSSAISNFLYFFVYDFVRSKVLGGVGSSTASRGAGGGGTTTSESERKSAALLSPVIRDLVSATIAGVVNVLLTAPLWRANSLFREPATVINKDVMGAARAGTNANNSNSRAGAAPLPGVSPSESTSGVSSGLDDIGGGEVQVGDRNTGSPGQPEQGENIVAFFHGTRGSSPQHSIAGSGGATRRPKSSRKSYSPRARGSPRTPPPSSHRTFLAHSPSFFTPQYSGGGGDNASSSLTATANSVFFEFTKLFIAVYRLARHDFADLMSGVSASLFLVLNPVVQFVVYDSLRRLAHGRLTFLADSRYFFLGLIAKLFATLSTYPMQIVQTRSRASQRRRHRYVLGSSPSPARSSSSSPRVAVPPPVKTSTTSRTEDVANKSRTRAAGAGGARGPSSFHDQEATGRTTSATSASSTKIDRTGTTVLNLFSMTRVLLKLYKQGGIRALYVGMEKKLLHSLLNSAFLFFFYEKIKKLWVERRRGRTSLIS